MRYRLVVFDMDGTILDTLEDLTDSVNYALGCLGFPIRSKQEVCGFVGNGIRKLIEQAVPKGTEKVLTDRVYQVFREYYRGHCAEKTQPYSGILPLLEELRRAGRKTAVVSNKADFAVQELCSRYFNGLFDTAVGEREGILRKPAPDSVYEVLRRLGVAKEEAVYIGDSDVDIETARNVGMDEIAVEWGFRTREFLEEKGAKRIVSLPAQIAEIVLRGR
ncbi:MAG: HAD family hydrolase [Lachnospiraceae bacterium]|nr:HAD family hydrolase [Lachnospiraceae bacterium]